MLPNWFTRHNATGQDLLCHLTHNRRPEKPGVLPFISGTPAGAKDKSKARATDGYELVNPDRPVVRVPIES
jgi:hypothetical protein